MKRCLALAFLCLLQLQSAKAQLPEVDTREIIRRGDMVEHVGGGIEDTDSVDYAIRQIASPPETDEDKWFLYVVGTKTCPACASLKKQWETDTILRAYAVPGHPADSWAHFTWYDYNDPFESWRWKRDSKDPKKPYIKINAFPTIVVQPPLNGKYGDPRTVVMQYVYEGEPAHLRDHINASIKAYVSTLKKHEELVKQKRIEEPKGLGSKTSVLLRSSRITCQKPRSKTQEVSERVRNGIRSSTVEDFPEVYAIAQQQVPPLDLPFEKPPAAPVLTPAETPVRDALKGARAAVKQIIVVKDKQQIFGEDDNSEIRETVEVLQGLHPETGKPIVIDVSEAAKKFAVAPEDAPVVLVVENGRVVERRQVKQPDAGNPALIVMLLGGVIGVTKAIVVGKIIVFMVKAVLTIIVVVLIGLLLFALVKKAGPQAAPAGPLQTAQPLDQHAIAAEVAAILAANAAAAAAPKATA